MLSLIYPSLTKTYLGVMVLVNTDIGSTEPVLQVHTLTQDLHTVTKLRQVLKAKVTNVYTIISAMY